jgi:hypothetical protein
VSVPAAPVEVPDMVTVTLETAAASAEAVRVTDWGVPGVSEKLDLLAATPWGRPLSVTVTGLSKPPTATAARLMDCPVAPAVSERVDGEELSEKSCGLLGELVPALLQPARTRQTQAVRTAGTAKGVFNERFVNELLRIFKGAPGKEG